MSEWQPIETAPKDGTWIFAYGKDIDLSKYPLVVFWDEGWECVRMGKNS